MQLQLKDVIIVVATVIIAGGVTWGMLKFFVISYFKNFKDDMSGIKDDFKEDVGEIKQMINGLPCFKHTEEINFIKGKLNGNGKGKTI